MLGELSHRLTFFPTLSNSHGGVFRDTKTPGKHWGNAMKQLGADMGAVVPQYMTAKEAARYLRVSISWLYLHSAEGKVPSVHFGRTVRFRKDDLDRWATTTFKGPRDARPTRAAGRGA